MVSIVKYLHLVDFDMCLFLGMSVVLNGTFLKQSVHISDNNNNQSIC